MTSLVKRGFVALFILLFFAWINAPQPLHAQIPSAPQNEDEEIIYIDGSGRIRVIDTNQVGPKLIDWVSPEDKFLDFATGDFNADGDAEIVAIKTNEGGRQLYVYDPIIVPNSLLGAPTTPNGIQWAELYRVSLNGLPNLIATGDFDLSIPGDEIVYGMQLIGSQRSEVTILARDMSLDAESVHNAARNWVVHTTTAAEGNFERVWQYITTGQIDEVGADEIVLIDGTRESVNEGIRSKIAAFRVDDGGLAAMTPFFERENVDTSWRYAEIAEMNGRPGAEIIATRSTANLLPNLFIFEYDLQRGMVRDLGDGCPDEPHESLTCPDDVMSLRLSPSPKWTFAADITDDDDDQEVAFFLRSVVNNQNPIRLFGLDFMETLSFNLTPSFTATVTIDNMTTVFTETNTLTVPSDYTGTVTFSDGRMIGRDEITTHWAIYYDVSKLDDFPNPVTGDAATAFNLWQRGAGGDTDGNGVDEVVVMRTDNIRTYAYRPDEPDKWAVLRNDVVATGNHSIELANLDRNGTLRFANELIPNDLVNDPAGGQRRFVFIGQECVSGIPSILPIPNIEIAINGAPPVDFQAFATTVQPAQTDLAAADISVTQQPSSISAPLVDWPSAVPWLKLSSDAQTPTTLVLEVVPSGIPQTGDYHEAQVSLLPVGLGSEFLRSFTVGFLCSTDQGLVPFAPR